MWGVVWRGFLRIMSLVGVRMKMGLSGMKMEGVVLWLSKADGYDKSRKFCQVMMDLSATRLYTRDDINQLTALMGYSVWERRGGWFTLPSGLHRPSCRHMWVQQLVMKKGKEVSKIV